jgi:hypothetical protein
MRALALGASLAAAAACSETVAPPAPSITYETEHFVILDDGSGLDSVTVVALAARLELELERVGQVLTGLTPPALITARVRPGFGLPYVTASDSSLTLWSDTLALDYLPHQLTHLYTRYARREFVEEGLAVYVSELLLPDVGTVHPYRGQPPHAWVSLFQIHGSLIALSPAYAATNLGYALEGSTFDASAWQLFIEGGSFVHWVVDTYGWPAWWEAYQTDDPATALGATGTELEDGWLAATRAQYPDPVPCEEALGAVGPREEFWCRRARGESTGR